MHRDPTFNAVAKQQQMELKERNGCGCCAMREEIVGSACACRIDREPGAQGHCRQWTLDQLWRGDA